MACAASPPLWESLFEREHRVANHCSVDDYASAIGSEPERFGVEIVDVLASSLVDSKFEPLSAAML